MMYLTTAKASPVPTAFKPSVRCWSLGIRGTQIGGKITTVVDAICCLVGADGSIYNCKRNTLPADPGGLGSGLGAEVCIPESQRALHVRSETIAVVAIAPFMAWLATRRELPTWARVVSGLVAAGTLAVDGKLLSAYSAGR